MASRGRAIKGRPDWLFIKLHCHGMDPRDEAARLGAPMRTFIEELLAGGSSTGAYKVHFVRAGASATAACGACHAD